MTRRSHRKSLLTLVAALALSGCASRPLSPIVDAARAGRADEIPKLVKDGEDPNGRAGPNDWTPLMHAVHKRQYAAAVALIKNGADLNSTAVNMTALMMAAGYGDAPMTRMLLENGANSRKAASDGSTALTAAVGGVPDIDNFTVGRCQTDTVAALLAFDPGLTVESNMWGRVALVSAGLGGCKDVLNLLK